MTITRNQFFLLLFIAMMAPLIIPKLLWLARSVRTIGVVEFIGHGDLGSVLGVSTYPVISFIAGKDTIHFRGNYNRPVVANDPIEIRYQPGDPADARMNSFKAIWGGTLPFVIWALLVCLALFFSPEIVPKKSRLRFGWWSLIRIVRLEDPAA